MMVPPQGPGYAAAAAPHVAAIEIVAQEAMHDAQNAGAKS
jgi:hypothetical protein